MHPCSTCECHLPRKRRRQDLIAICLPVIRCCEWGNLKPGKGFILSMLKHDCGMLQYAIRYSDNVGACVSSISCVVQPGRSGGTMQGFACAVTRELARSVHVSWLRHFCTSICVHKRESRSTATT